MRFGLTLLLAAFITGSGMAQAPVADFTSNITTGCAALTVQFLDKSTGDPKSWAWDLGNGQLWNGPNAVGSYSAPGTYTVTLVVRNANGISQKVQTNYITVYPSPTAKFTADLNLACLPATVQFTDQSVANGGAITQWDWDFGDSSGVVHTQSPSHTYKNPGFYDVSLLVTSANGCTGRAVYGRFERIVNGVKADFEPQGPSTCHAPFVMTYKNLTSGPGNITYSWDLGNSSTSTQISPSAAYGAAGNYVVKVKAVSQYGCSDSTQKTVAVAGVVPSFSLSSDSVCVGGSVTFKNTNVPPPVSAKWNFGDGTTSLFVNPLPKTYTTIGTYPVTMVATFSGCTDSVTKNVVITPPPAADFTAVKTRTCKAPFTVNFQNLTANAVSASWDFGDGSPAGSGLNPSHTYNINGTFNVTATVTTAGGCVSKVTKPQFIVIMTPSAFIGNPHSGVCVGSPYAPQQLAFAAEGISKFAWDFGDGSPIDTNSYPTHIYSATGTYDVKLTITSKDGCTDSKTYPGAVQVGLPPVVDFSVSQTNVCRSEPVVFTNLSTPALTPSTPVRWDFHDGTVDTLSVFTVAHKFKNIGAQDVTLYVKNNGCEASKTINGVVFLKPPFANFGYSVPNCANKTTITFLDSSLTDATYGAISYMWDFGDPAHTKDPTVGNPSFTYPGPASTIAYTAELIVTNGTCSDTLYKNVQLVNEKADFTIPNAKVCRKQKATYTSTNDTLLVKKFQWIVDGGSAAKDSLRTLDTLFATFGAHTLALMITDINGCTDLSAAKTVNVVGPTAGFTVQNGGGCVNDSIQILDASSSASTTIKAWQYDFKTGTGTNNKQNPKVFYKNPGSYLILQVVYDDLNCTDTSVVDSAVVVSKPFASFFTTQTTYCPSTPLQFIDSSSGNALTYSWFFGDGGTDNAQNPMHSYPAKDSSYTVKLMITDAQGCKDSMVRANYVDIRAPKFTYSVKDTTSVCPPLETKFAFNGSNFESFYWDFADGQTSTLDTTNHFYNNYGNYNAKLYVTGYGGCRDSASISISVPDPAAGTSAIYNPANPAACNEITVDFSLTVPAFTAFELDFGDGTADTTHKLTATHTYNYPNQYTPFVRLKDSTGCKLNIYTLGQVRVLGAVPLFGIDKKKFCDSGTVYFSDYSQDGIDPIVTRNWVFGDGTGGSFPKDAVHSYTGPGLFVPALTVTSQSGCTTTFTDTVRVLATPQPVIGSLDQICKNLALTLTGSVVVPPDTAIVWNWNLGNGTTYNGQNVPGVYYKDSGLYHITLQATNSLGCKGDTSKDVTVFPIPAINVTGDTTLLAGTGINMPVSFGANSVAYAWTPATGLSCTDCAIPYANPKFTTKYSVKVTDANGCENTRTLSLVVVCNNKNFFIPNTFSPNNDGNNDRFYPRGTGIDRIQALRIFNRWGEMIFEKRNFAVNDASAGWDGTYKGHPASSDTYIYMIDIVCDNASIITYKGNITLIR